MLHICVLQSKTWKKKRGAKSFPHMPCPHFGGFSLGLDDIQELWANLTPIQMGPVAIFYQESPLVRCNTIILQREILEGDSGKVAIIGTVRGGMVAVERSHCCHKEWLLQLQPQSPTSNHRLWQWWNQKGWKISHTPSFCQGCLCLDLQVYLSSMGLLSQKNVFRFTVWSITQFRHNLTTSAKPQVQNQLPFFEVSLLSFYSNETSLLELDSKQPSSNTARNASSSSPSAMTFELQL